MRLTEEEMEKLKRNVAKIDDYIRYEIVPNLRGTSISVGFGEIVKDASQWSGGRKYHLGVSPTGVSGRSGNLGLTMMPVNASPEALRKSFCSPDAGLALLREWPRVKEELLKHIQDIEEKRAALDDFTV